MHVQIRARLDADHDAATGTPAAAAVGVQGHQTRSHRVYANIVIGQLQPAVSSDSKLRQRHFQMHCGPVPAAPLSSLSCRRFYTAFHFSFAPCNVHCTWQGTSVSSQQELPSNLAVHRPALMSTTWSKTLSALHCLCPSTVTYTDINSALMLAAGSTGYSRLSTVWCAHVSIATE